MDTIGGQDLKPEKLMSYLPKIIYNSNSSATPLCKYRNITTGQAFTCQESTKRRFPRIPCALYNTTIHHATSGTLSLFPLPVTSRSESVSHQLLSVSLLQIRFNAPLFRHAAITKRQHFLIVYF